MSQIDEANKIFEERSNGNFKKADVLEAEYRIRYLTPKDPLWEKFKIFSGSVPDPANPKSCDSYTRFKEIFKDELNGIGEAMETISQLMGHSTSNLHQGLSEAYRIIYDIKERLENES